MEVLADHKTCPSCQGEFAADLRTCPRDGSVLQEPGEWSVGQIIQGKYVISRAAGADLAVSAYAARTVESDQPRLLRVLRPALAANEAAAREFRRIARLLENLAHPNLVAVESSGVAEDGRPYLVTEFLEGGTLDDVLRAEGSLTAQRACRLARQIASALVAAGRIGLLHLALEPRNIIILAGPPEDERVKVNGLGVAHVRLARVGRHYTHRGPNAPPSDLTLRDLMPVAPAYSSPEQALGYPPELFDARTDLYALGVMLYQMIAGRMPVEPIEAAGVRDGAALAWLDTHLTQAPRPLHPEVDGRQVPQQLADLVMQLLEKRLELRPPTAQAVVEEIELIEGGLAAQAALQPQQHREFQAPPESAPAGKAQGASVAAPAAGLQNEPDIQSPAPAPVAAGAGAQLDDVLLRSVAAPPSKAGATEELAAASGGAVPPSQGAGAEGAPPQRDSGAAGAAYTSPIFRTMPPPAPVSRSRWVVAVVSTLIIAGAVWFFATRARTGWLGAGPATPLKPSEIKSVEGAGGNSAPQSKVPASSRSASGPAQSPAQPQQQAASPPLSHNDRARAGNSAEGPAAPPPVTGAANAAAQASVPAVHSATPVNHGPPAQAAAGAPDVRRLEAEVKDAVAAGDVFFGVGKYDLAIQAYERPLKHDPKNKVLLGKIARAKRAKAAEEEFLGQP